jgi:hypothetical protein
MDLAHENEENKWGTKMKMAEPRHGSQWLFTMLGNLLFQKLKELLKSLII